MTHIIDRRPQAKNKSAANRERFMKRYRDKIKDAVTNTDAGKSIQDIAKDGVSVPVRGIKEPFIGHGQGGVWDRVIPGNKRYAKGDSIAKPRGSQGKGGAGNSDGDEEDEFTFTLTKEEFMEYFFDGLELPNLVKKKLAETDAIKQQRAGYKTVGTPNNLDIIRSLRNATGRRIALNGALDKRQEKIEEEEEGEELIGKVEELKRRKAAIPFIDPFDLRYRNTIPVPKPTTKAVMFCIMDVSASMGEFEKDLAKRYFILLYLFLTKAYKKVDIVFIRHTTDAQEVSEQDFFYSRSSGGTEVSSALKLTSKIIEERYAGEEWNIYVSQASDGDNWSSDTHDCMDILKNQIIPYIQYFTYMEISIGDGQFLLDAYKSIARVNKNFAVGQVHDPDDVYPLFRKFFKKSEAV